MSDYSGSEDEDFDIDVVEQQGAFFLPLKTKCKAHEKNVRNLTTSVTFSGFGALFYSEGVSFCFSSGCYSFRENEKLRNCIFEI